MLRADLAGLGLVTVPPLLLWQATLWRWVPLLSPHCDHCLCMSHDIEINRLQWRYRRFSNEQDWQDLSICSLFRWGEHEGSPVTHLKTYVGSHHLAPTAHMSCKVQLAGFSTCSVSNDVISAGSVR